MQTAEIIETKQKTVEAYRLYSLFYAPIALLAYWVVWRGNILKHIAFFRNIVKPTEHNVKILDLATGDGSLTLAALKNHKSRLARLICVDLSEDMLSKAKKKIKLPNVEFLKANVENLPFADQSWERVTCFGGFNSFTDPQKAMKEMVRLLEPDGILKGSALLLPKSPWRQKLIESWIRQGYQTVKITREVFHEWVITAGFSSATYHQYGDVLLFECRK